MPRAPRGAARARGSRSKRRRRPHAPGIGPSWAPSSRADGVSGAIRVVRAPRARPRSRCISPAVVPHDVVREADLLLLLLGCPVGADVRRELAEHFEEPCGDEELPSMRDVLPEDERAVGLLAVDVLPGNDQELAE